MQEFRFDETVAGIKVEGKVYTFDPGDADLQDALLEASSTLAKFDATGASGPVVKLMSEKVRGIVGLILGEDAKDEIFSGRKNNLAGEVRLLNAIFKAIEESGASASAAAAISELMEMAGERTLDEEG